MKANFKLIAMSTIALAFMQFNTAAAYTMDKRAPSLHTLLSLFKEKTPMVGRTSTQVIRDTAFVNQYLFDRRSNGDSGLWINGRLPLSESDYKFKNENNLKADSKSYHFAIGVDRSASKSTDYGLFFAYSSNSEDVKNIDMKQDKKSYTFGYYKYNKWNRVLYSNNKISYNRSIFNNEVARAAGTTNESDIVMNSLNNEFSLGFIVAEHIKLEGYLNSVFILSSSFKEDEKGGTANDYDTDLDTVFYNAVGGRASISPNMGWQASNIIIRPYAKGFVNFAITGKDLKGTFKSATTKKKMTFESLNSTGYGVTLALDVKSNQYQNFNTTVAYNFHHYDNTSHSLDFALNWNY